ncbi:MAG: hypothetical protein ACD_51C00271G0004 [uncultured bacterium]|nr:MAG: hypothetical protein ACD_51C00271G0004 [uncultured bacterium]OGJ47794.1 MAG: hypothetical protein A2244_04100 [Candidatus Peregrinibacteria bacterium RIFOXYA2_FULL_41_18]OGJ49101.1 MAG: hypothetical protein A2344_06010 [Candidatus Peregrinibacteria bacterium RIFOXYB12_FULL_41_12]OGJ53118.1 MAG: hypothetical protein A2336_05515 [Candidatus Peregrinibacteria bacterium RIFOXYB2_FULL_41_88]OGJ53338.1 MAG: hypothetical protein A2448_04185 [Candidatus Peregrinibacteria bacterium RIFOXYC2_FULL
MFDDLILMFEGIPWWQILIASILAFIPVFIWVSIFVRRKQHSPKSLIKVFLLGTLTVLPILWFQSWLNPYGWIEHNITNVTIGLLATFILVGVTEEIVKMGVVRIADTSKMKIQTINDAVKFSILAALGFAFSENIVYFSQVMSSGNLGALFTTVIFRSAFTVCGHLIFSSIFGYFYGVGKFAQPIIEQQKWTGEKHTFATIINKITRIPKETVVRYESLLTGLGIAMGAHAAFNFALQMNRTIEAIIIIIIGYGYVHFLMNRKAGHLALAGESGKSLMGKTDEDVVLELVGMWYQNGKYQDVIEICERLLMRDPTNKVVQLFKAKALDQAKVSKAVNSVKSLFSENETQSTMSILEELRKKKTEMERIEIIKKNADKLLENKPNTPQTNNSNPQLT